MRRRISLALLSVVSLAVVATATVLYPDELLGTWGNVDSLTAGLGKIRIAISAEGGLDVYGYGICGPGYCEWGPTPLLLASMSPRYEPEWALAIWNLDPIMTVMVFTREGEFLVVETFTYWTDGTGAPLREIALLRQIE